MKLVIDNNILFSLMNPESTASYIFFTLDATFLAPAFVLEEFKKYKGDAFHKSKLSHQEFEMHAVSISQKLQILPVSTYGHLTEQIRPSLPDEKDIPYIAAAVVCKA